MSRDWDEAVCLLLLHYWSAFAFDYLVSNSDCGEGKSDHLFDASGEETMKIGARLSALILGKRSSGSSTLHAFGIHAFGGDSKRCFRL